AVERDVGRGLTREREAADVRILLLLTAREVHDRHAALDWTTLPAKALRLGPRGLRGEGDPLRIVGELERPAAEYRPAAAAHGSADLSERIGRLLAGRDVADDQFRVPFLRGHAVGEPLTVVRERGRADVLPVHDVLHAERGLRGRRRGLLHLRE